MRARDVAGLVLDEDATVLREAEQAAELVAPRERRDGEAVAVDGGDPLVEGAHERAEVGIAHAAVTPDVVGVEQFSIADERVRLRIVPREADARDVELAAQHMVDVVAGNDARAGERIRVVEVGLCSAAGADEPGDGTAHGLSRTPVLVLKSSISSSHSAAAARVCSQKAGARRAWKSSIDTPCCSTHV